MRHHVIHLCLIPLLAFAAEAKEVLPGPIPAAVVEIIDGYTLAVRAHVWLGQEITVRARLDGIDAPELRGRCPAERALAVRARGFLVSAVADGPVALTHVHHDKYGGRVVAHITTEAGLDLADALLLAGLARPYNGRGPRPRWCAGT